MRRFWVLMRTAALETLAEPLTVVLFLSGLAVVYLAPAFHYHQFGEAGRLARECGFSVLLVFGLAFATAAAVRLFVRAFESGTAAMALARAVPRALFFGSQLAGVGAALALFALAVLSATALSTGSCVVAAFLRTETGTSAQVFGPVFLAGFGGTLAAFAAAALGNRLFRIRFCLAACLFMTAAQLLALGGVIATGTPFVPSTFPGFFSLFLILLPPFAVLFSGCAVFVLMAGALATRLTPQAACAAVAGAVFCSFVSPVRAILPDIGGFWLVDRLAGGGTVAWREVLSGVLAAAALGGFWFVAGAWGFSRREIA